MGQTQAERPGWINRLRRFLFLGPHTCPWWFGYTFDNPLRRLVHDPNSILGSYVGPGQTVVDIGCGLGYFSIALARIVAPGGKVIALDIQPQMTKRARRRAQDQDLGERIDFRICKPEQLGVTNPVDFVLAFWVVHEVIDPKRLLLEIRSFLQPHGQLLIAEPKAHVSATQFAAIVELARQVGYKTAKGPLVRFSRSVICAPHHTEVKEEAVENIAPP